MLDQQYRELFDLVKLMRSAHWDAKKGSRSAAHKEHLYGLEIDKKIRDISKLRQSLEKEIQQL